MKKILSLGLVVIMLFALVGCNGRAMEEKLAELEAKLQEQERMLMDLTKDDNDLLTLIMELEEEKTEQLNQITVLEETVERMKADAAEANEDRDNEIAALQEEINRLEQECEQKQKAIDEIEDALSVEKIDEDHYKNDSETYSQPISLIACGYKFWRILYKRNDVKIKVYFGHNDYFSKDHPDYNRFYAEISVGSGFMDGYNIHYYDNLERVSFVSNYYDYSCEGYKFSSVDEMKYSEVITLSQELFVDETGFINIDVIDVFQESENEFRRGYISTEVFLFYKAVGDYIILSTEQF
ncbi:MAG: hypothetical protein IKC35_01545 [Clostridia bacterium]|nr:hypothetical protein [Clostridia bacterium]